MIEQHAVDLVHALLWVLGVTGTAIGVVLWWGFQTLMERFEKQDAAIAEIAEMVRNELKELRDMNHALDTRLTRIEAVVMATHNAPPIV